MSSDRDAVLEKYGLQRSNEEDPNAVDWKEGNSAHPRNWPLRRRIADTSLMFLIQFITTAMSTAGTSLGLAAKDEHGLTRTTSVVVFLLTYQLARMVGSIVLPPWTETFGRKTLFIASSFIGAIGTLLVGVVPHVSGAIIGRVISGAMSAMGGSVSAGTMADLYGTEARIWVIFLWTWSAIAGLAVGPIYGSYLAVAPGWRWAFYIVAIILAAVGFLFSFMRENRPTVILQKEVARVKRETDIQNITCDTKDGTQFGEFVKRSLARPLRFLFTEPIVLTVVLLSATAWAFMFLFTESLTVVFGLYGFTDAQTSLFFIPILIGTLPSALVRIRDHRVIRQKHEAGRSLAPEDKIFGFALGAPFLATGLWWFAWTTPQAVHTHWIVPSLALVLVGFAITEFEYVLSGYLADCYVSYASSAVAAMAILRAALGGTLPLFAYYMFTGISTNAASSILAALATGFCIAPPVFMKYGETLRARSPFARESVQAMD